MDVDVNLFSAIKKATKKFPRRLSKIQTNEQKLRDATARSHEVLFKAQTVFPFNLFPDSVIVDREKLSIINRFFFRVAKITSVPIKDILSVEADVGPFFGSIYLTSRYFFTNPHSINFLWRKDALELQKLLQGYIIASEQDINCFNINRNNLVGLLEDLGQSNEKTPVLQN